MLREKRRIAFFGGTFDPLHTGHLEMARAAADALSLHRVYFVPAWQNPLKKEAPQAPAEDRLAMIRLGIEEDPLFGVWEGELFREGPSYTLHSVEHIERVYPNCHLFWLIGTDQLPGLTGWREIETLVRKVGFILVRRPGHELLWPRIPGLTLYPVDNPLSPVSATEVRRRLGCGESVAGMLPAPVERYIRQHGLYR